MLPVCSEEGAVETFIVRIYKRNAADAQWLAGAVEIPGKNGLIPFDSLAALEAILSTPAQAKRQWIDRKNGGD